MSEERFEPLGETVDFLGQRDKVLVLRRERFHSRLRVADRALQRAQPLVERLEFLFLEGQGVELCANRFEKNRRLFLQLGGLASHFRVELGGGVHALLGLLGQLLDPRDRLIRFGRLLQSLVQLAHLHIHRPDHLVHPIGLDHGVLDRLLLAFERFGFVRDVLGKGIDCAEPLLGALAQLVELGEWAELLLDLFDGGHRRRRVLARLA